MLTREEWVELLLLRRKFSADIERNLGGEGLRDFSNILELERKDAAAQVRVVSCDFCGGWDTSARIVSNGDYEVCSGCMRHPSEKLRAILAEQQTKGGDALAPDVLRANVIPPRSVQPGGDLAIIVDGRYIESACKLCGDQPKAPCTAHCCYRELRIDP